jgi:hypothetical protein
MTKTLVGVVAGTLTAAILLMCAAAGTLFLAVTAASCAGPPRSSPGAVTSSESPVPLRGSDSAVGDCADPKVVLLRAATWLTPWNGGPVPYLSSTDPSTWFMGYRRDCSGYASMALGLPGPGLDTAALAARATPIRKTDLRGGDLLINPAPDRAGHVVIFDHWTDASMTSYLGFEQSGDGGTHHRTIPYPYFGNYLMSPYRWFN